MSLKPGILGQQTELIDGVKVSSISEYTAGAGISVNNVLKCSGSIGYAYSTVTGSTLLNDTHCFVSASGSVTYSITLPTAVGCSGRVYIIKSNMNAGVLLTVNTTSSQTIDGALAVVLSRYSALQVISSGSNWEVF